MNPNEYLVAGCPSALGVHGEYGYPGFSDAPLDGFRHLRSDIERHGQVFLTGSDAELLNLLSAANQLDSERPKGLAGLR